MSQQLVLPPGNTTVAVKILRTCQMSYPAQYFLHPVHPAHPKLGVMDSYSFVIEHPSEGKVIYDLGVRKDVRSAAPAVLNQFPKSAGVHIEVAEDVATQLKNGGVELESIDAIIWGHHHLDHAGDPSTFPPSVKLVVGPGTLAHAGKGYPADENSLVLETDLKGREVVELVFDKEIFTGGFKAYDYFADGSFYLLEVPGHCPGHMAALARVTSTTFLLMAGDTCHHVGVLRPSPLVPIPSSFGSELSGRTEPFYTPPLSQPSVYHDLPTTRESIKKLQVFDAHPDVFVLLAHDNSVEEVLEYFPAKANDWKAKGWKENGFWAFLQRGNKAYRLD